MISLNSRSFMLQKHELDIAVGSGSMGGNALKNKALI